MKIEEKIVVKDGVPIAVAELVDWSKIAKFCTGSSVFEDIEELKKKYKIKVYYFNQIQNGFVEDK